MSGGTRVREYRLQPPTPAERERLIGVIRRNHETALLYDTIGSPDWALFCDGQYLGLFPTRDIALRELARFNGVRTELHGMAQRAVAYVRARSGNPMFYGDEHRFHRPLPSLTSGILYNLGMYLLYSPVLDEGDGRYPRTSDPDEAASFLVNCWLNEIHTAYIRTDTPGRTMVDEAVRVLGVGRQAERVLRDADAQADAIIEDILRRM